MEEEKAEARVTAFPQDLAPKGRGTWHCLPFPVFHPGPGWAGGGEEGGLTWA